MAWKIKKEVKDVQVWTSVMPIQLTAAEQVQAIVDWLQEIKNSGCRGVTLGLSGGKDSTVVAMLAKMVWGPENVHAIIMPNHNWDSVEDALAIARALKIKYFIKPIKETYEALIKDLPQDEKALTNVAPRIRMTTLYLMAQAHGHRVIRTGNRSERYIGWCTKYGDMGCDFNPIAHLTCGEVVDIGLYLAAQYDTMLDPKYIEIPPADGLTGKTDEDNFGFTYNQLDSYILNGTSGDRKVDKKIEKMHEASLHKLTMPATMEMESL